MGARGRAGSSAVHLVVVRVQQTLTDVLGLRSYAYYSPLLDAMQAGTRTFHPCNTFSYAAMCLLFIPLTGSCHHCSPSLQWQS